MDKPKKQYIHPFLQEELESINQMISSGVIPEDFELMVNIISHYDGDKVWFKPNDTTHEMSYPKKSHKLYNEELEIVDFEKLVDISHNGERRNSYKVFLKGVEEPRYVTLTKTKDLKDVHRVPFKFSSASSPENDLNKNHYKYLISKYNNSEGLHMPGGKGDPISIQSMSDKHLRNTIRRLERLHQEGSINTVLTDMTARLLIMQVAMFIRRNQPQQIRKDVYVNDRSNSQGDWGGLFGWEAEAGYWNTD